MTKQIWDALFDVLAETEIYRRRDPDGCPEHIVRMIQAMLAEKMGYEKRADWQGVVEQVIEKRKCRKCQTPLYPEEEQEICFRCNR